VTPKRRENLTDHVAQTAAAVLRVCQLQPQERVTLLIDDATATVFSDAFSNALDAAHDPVILSLRPRRPAFADLPSHAVDALLAADLVIDLTTSPWLYSDSFTRFGQECGRAGTRLALIWGTIDSVRTVAACPPSARLAERCRRGLEALSRARTLHLRSPLGTDLVAELGDPAEYPRAFIGEPPVRAGTIGAPLCASVTAPFVPGSAQGTIVFTGAGRFQGPENRPIRARQPVEIPVASGRVVDVIGDHPAAITLADWFSSAGPEDGSVIMDCNIGFDPRADLRWADNTVVHSHAGGVMIGIGNPYQYHPEGSHRPGYHLDLMSPGVDLDLDGAPFLRGGDFTPESGVI
jgi:hypothetical protein